MQPAWPINVYRLRFPFYASFRRCASATIRDHLVSRQELHIISVLPPNQPSHPNYLTTPPWKRRNSGEVGVGMAVKNSRFCVDLVRQRDYENYLCVLGLPGAFRRGAFAVRAFNAEVANIPLMASSTHSAANLRYVFWRDALRDMQKRRDTGRGIIPKQPIAEELCWLLCEQPQIEIDLLHGLVEARSKRVQDQPFSTLAELHAYSQATVAATLHLIAQQMPGYDNDRLHLAINDLGRSIGIANTLRAVPHFLSRGAVVLPQEILSRYGLDETTLLTMRQPERARALQPATRDMCDEAIFYLAEDALLSRDLPRLERKVLFPFVSCKHYLRVLKECRFDLFDKRALGKFDALAWKLLKHRIKMFFA